MFLNTYLKDGRRISIALNHVENIYADADEEAVFVMLPTVSGQRIFPTCKPYHTIITQINKLLS